MLLGMAVLAGCASFSSDGGLGRVDALTRERTGHEARWIRGDDDQRLADARIDELLQAPLDADRAVELALWGNRGLQARMSELGIAEADLVRAGRLANPSLGFSRITGGGETDIERGVMFDVLGLLTMPLAQRAEQRRFDATQLQVALDAVTTATQARIAFYGAVTAAQLVRYAEQVKAAADASDELALRMLQAGNFSKLSQMRQQAFANEAATRLTRARLQSTQAQESLVRLLGLTESQRARLVLPEHLADLPQAPVDMQQAERQAMDRRLDVMKARLDTETTAERLGLVRTTRFINVLDIGYANKSQTGQARQDGYQVALELPLFDRGSVRTARAEAVYRQSLAEAADVALRAQSQVRERHAALLEAYDVARRYRDRIVPLSKQISDENLLRYNGMLVSVFELLADARDQVASVSASIEALRDYWTAEAELQLAVTGGSPASWPKD